MPEVRCTIGDENSPCPASAYRGAKTVLRTVLGRGKVLDSMAGCWGAGVEEKLLPYSIRYYKTAGAKYACRLLFMGTYSL